jgi:hypothetical protein
LVITELKQKQSITEKKGMKNTDTSEIQYLIILNMVVQYQIYCICFCVQQANYQNYFYKKCQEHESFKTTNNADNYISLLQDLCRISNPHSIDPRTGTLKMRDLKVVEYEKVLENIKFL